jgi:hypothetical protein
VQRVSLHGNAGYGSGIDQGLRQHRRHQRTSTSSHGGWAVSCPPAILSDRVAAAAGPSVCVPAEHPETPCLTSMYRRPSLSTSTVNTAPADNSIHAGQAACEYS